MFRRSDAIALLDSYGAVQPHLNQSGYLLTVNDCRLTVHVGFQFCLVIFRGMAPGTGLIAKNEIELDECLQIMARHQEIKREQQA